MGRSEDQMKKKVKEVKKSPISMFWIGTSTPSPLSTCVVGIPSLDSFYLSVATPSWPYTTHPLSSFNANLACTCIAILGFIIFGGLVFEALTRFFS